MHATHQRNEKEDERSHLQIINEQNRKLAVVENRIVLVCAAG